jgi:hypothetical protein
VIALTDPRRLAHSGTAQKEAGSAVLDWHALLAVGDMASRILLAALLACALVACGGRSVDDGGGTGTGNGTGSTADPPAERPIAIGGSVKSVDRSCTKDEECAVVFAGAVCGCDCAMQAIAAKEVSAYLAQQEAARASCAEHVLCGPCRAAPPARCAAGACTLAP